MSSFDIGLRAPPSDDRVTRASRVALAGIGASIVTATVVIGFGSRVAMFAVRLLNGSHNGEYTHSGAVAGAWTVEGTMNLVFGALFFVPMLFVAYVAVRPVLPTRRSTRAIASAIFATAVGAPIAIDTGNYEFYRYTSPLVSMALFMALLPLAGATLSLLTERWSGGGRPTRPRPRALDIVWSFAVAAGTLLVAVADFQHFRSVSSLLI